MNNTESIVKFKEALINTGLFKKISSRNDQYRCKYCPYCNDMKWHMYVKINVTDDSPVLYHCFKCNVSGILNKTFLEYYNIEELKIPKQTYRKRLDVTAVSTKINEASCTIDDNMDLVKKYIQYRVGVTPTLEELQCFQALGNPFNYIKDFLNPDIKSDYEIKKRCWFKLTNGNISGRSYDDDEDRRWCKYNSKNCYGKALYSMRTGIDTHSHINIVIAEGVFDLIGLYYHYPIPNALHIGVLGSDYNAGIDYVLNMGIFGKSVTIKIFKDSDIDIDKIYIDRNRCRLFKRIEIYGNSISKDYGVTDDEIEIVRLKSFSIL